MSKKKGLTHEQRLIKALEQLPNPIEDKRHGVLIRFENDWARSNERRFEHIALSRHGLTINDITRIPRYIKTAVLRKDIERKETFNLFVKRNSYNEEYIKISLTIKESNSHEAIVKTIYIVRNLK